MRLTPARASVSAMKSAAVLLIWKGPGNREMGSVTSADVVLQNAQVGDRVCHAEPEASADAKRCDQVQVLAPHFRYLKFCHASPDINNRQIICQRQGELVHRRLVLAVGRQ